MSDRSERTMESRWYVRGGGLYTATLTVRGDGLFASATRSVEGCTFREVVAKAIELEKQLNEAGSHKLNNGATINGVAFELVGLVKEEE